MFRMTYQRPKAWRDKISKALKGRTISQESREKSSKTMKENHFSLGIVLTKRFSEIQESMIQEIMPNMAKIGDTQ